LYIDNLVVQVFIVAISRLAITVAIVAITILATKKEPTNTEAKNPLLGEAQAQVSVTDNPDLKDYTPKEKEVEALIRKIQELEDEKEALRREVWKSRGKPPEILGLLFIPYGAIAFILSVLFNSLILAYIGLGLTLWGSLLLFIRPTRYVKSSLLNSMTISPLTTIHQVIEALNHKGKGIYLPPQYLKAFKGGTIFVPYGKDLIIPPIEEVAQEKVFLKNPKGVCLTPPGLSLTNLYEDELGKDFASVNLEHLQNNLPKLFIEGLKIAENFEMDMEGDMIHARITGTFCGELCKEARKIPNICYLGCPLCSSIAIALTRATGKPVTIEKTNLSTDGKTVEAYYRILGTTSLMGLPSQERELAPVEVSSPSKPTERHPGYLLPSLVGLLLAAFGSAILAWVGWLTWYDITTWSKSLALIFFGSRTSEAISLGIGMKVIYYLLIGSALLLSGIFAFLRKRRRKG